MNYVELIQLQAKRVFGNKVKSLVGSHRKQLPE